MAIGTLTSRARDERDYRWVILLLMCPLAMSNTALWVSPAPLLTAIQQTLGIEIGKAGVLVTLITLISGVFMFSGSLIIDRLGLRAATILSMGLLVAGAGASHFATSYRGIFAARMVVGIGVGLCTPLPGALTMAWFPGREQPYVNMLTNVVAFVGMSLAFVGAAPLLQALGSWQNVLSTFAAIPLIALLAWILLGRNPMAILSHEPAPAATAQQQGGIALALRRREIWLLTLTMIGQMWAFNTFSTFLPAFLETVRGLTRVEAGRLSSLMPLAGLAGALVCGLGTGILGRRKPFMLPLMAIALCASLFIINVHAGPLAYAGIVVLGFCSSGLNPPLMTTVMDLKNATPQMIGGAFALIYGVSFIISFFVSPLFGVVTADVGISKSMTLFSLPLLLSIAALAVIPETGPKRRSGPAA